MLRIALYVLAALLALAVVGTVVVLGGRYDVGAAFTDCRDGLAWGERTFERALAKADRI